MLYSNGAFPKNIDKRKRTKFIDLYRWTMSFTNCIAITLLSVFFRFLSLDHCMFCSYFTNVCMCPNKSYTIDCAVPSTRRHCCHDKCISFSTGQFHFTPSWFKWCDKLPRMHEIKPEHSRIRNRHVFFLPSKGKSIFIALQNQLVHLFYHSISHFTVLTITCRGWTRIIF